jgi:hydrogenase maturation protease
MYPQNKKTLILGLGNDILTDDAIGILVVRRLSEILKDFTEFDFRETTEMGIALLDYIEGYHRLVVVDAVIDNENGAGVVRELSMNDFAGAGCSTPHFLGLRDTIEFGKRMDMLMPSDILILGIGVKDPFSVSEKLSPELSTKLDEIVHDVKQRIERFAELQVNG